MDWSQQDSEICDIIRSLHRVLEAMHRPLKDSGAFSVNGSRVEALKTISEGGSLSIGEVSRKAGLSPAAATKAVDRLEARGYVSRSRDTKDRRIVKVHLTVAGKHFVQKPLNPIHGAVTTGLESLRIKELHVIRRSVERLADIVEAASLRPRSFLMKNRMFPAG